MASRELELLLKARNLTNDAFRAVEASLKGTQEETKKTTSALQDMSSGFSETLKAGVAFGGGMAIGQKAAELLLGTIKAIPAFTAEAIKEFAAAGSALADMAAMTGLSTTALQEYAFAGKLVGVSSESIATAVTRMSRTIAEGNAPVRKAIQDLGIDFAALKRESPEDQFRLIANALKDVAGAGQQAAIANDIFGRSPEILKLVRSGFADAADEAHRLGVVMGEDAIDAADRLDDAGAKLDEIWKSIKRTFAENVVVGSGLVEMLEDVVEILGRDNASVKKGITQDVIELEKAVLKFIPMIGPMVSGLEQLRHGLGLLADRLPDVKTPLFNPAAFLPKQIDLDAMAKQQVKAVQIALKEIDSARKASAEAAKKFARDEFNARAHAVADEERLLEKWARDEKALADAVAKFKIDSFKLISDHAEEFWKEQERMAGEVGKKLLDQIEKEKRARDEAHQKLIGNIHQIGGALSDLGTQMGGVFGVMLDSLGQVAGGIGTVIEGIDQWRDAGAGLGGFVTKLSAGLGVLGTGIGIIKGIAGAIGGLFGGKEREVNKLRDQFLQSVGGAEALRKKALEAGVSVDAIFNAKDSRKGLESAIAMVTKGFGDWEAAQALVGEAQEALNDAVKRYGFEVSELGPLMQQQELDKQAQGLLQDWKILNAAKIDAVAILQRMAPAMNEYLQTVVASGAAVPEAMRAQVEKMIEMGLLLDENGNAFGSLAEAGITFTETLTEGLSRAIEAINRLVSALTGQINVPPIHVPVIEDRSGGGGGGGEGFVGGDGGGPVEQLRRGGVVLPFMPRAANGIVAAQHGGSPVVIGEGGESELVAPVQKLANQIGAAAARAALGAAGGVIHVHVHMDGREVANAVVDRNRRGGLPIAAGSIRR
jgi:hypothetical protein